MISTILSFNLNILLEAITLCWQISNNFSSKTTRRSSIGKQEMTFCKLHQKEREREGPWWLNFISSSSKYILCLYSTSLAILLLRWLKMENMIDGGSSGDVSLADSRVVLNCHGGWGWGLRRDGGPPFLWSTHSLNHHILVFVILWKFRWCLYGLVALHHTTLH